METVGVGQSEIEIAGLADVTIVTVVPEAGDEVQTMKAGLMEIADIFVVNKSDRPDADLFVKNLRMMLAPAFHTKQQTIPIIKTIASQKEGIEELLNAIIENINNSKQSAGSCGQTVNSKRHWLLAEKAYHLIQQKRMADINKAELKKSIELLGDKFNLYSFVQTF